MKRFGDGLATVLLVFWVGGLWAVGYLVAPTLFAQLSDRQLAGNLAGVMFTWVAYLGMAAGTYLLLHRLGSQGMASLKQGAFWMVFLMLLISIGQQYGIQPIMQGLKDQAFPQAVMESVFRNRFAAWHGVSSVIYLVQSVLGLLLVWRNLVLR
jgi:hypothetical protein